MSIFANRRPRAQARSQGGSAGALAPSPVLWFVPHHQTNGAPSALLTPSPILIHDLGVFNIDICAIWHKIAQNDTNLLKIV